MAPGRPWSIGFPIDSNCSRFVSPERAKGDGKGHFSLQTSGQFRTAIDLSPHASTGHLAPCVTAPDHPAEVRRTAHRDGRRGANVRRRG
jgi:hypothetical protein